TLILRLLTLAFFQAPWGQTTVTQQEGQVTVKERGTFQTTCTYQVTNFYGLLWYQQRKGQGPQLISYQYRARVDSGRFSSALTVETSQVLLNVRDAELQDSATYFCALSPHWCPQLPALHRNVGGALRSSSLPATACM
uniref:Immunoglobulin V-set domain-containing protein n=1 Tax=Aquila chrysaetos chrysaetos TaxID=223781 RepID=A0A663F383_AQUCH